MAAVAACEQRATMAMAIASLARAREAVGAARLAGVQGEARCSLLARCRAVACSGAAAAVASFTHVGWEEREGSAWHGQL